MAEMTLPQTFDFELVSPERRLLSEKARMVVIPGEEGDFGVLAGHTALVATIRPGVVEVFGAGEGTTPRRIFIAGGFADVSATNCTVLAEEAVNVSDLSKADLEQTLRNLSEDLMVAKDEFDIARINRQLVLTRAKLEAVTGKVALA